MQFGVTLPNFQYGAPATRDHLLVVAEAAEDAGYTSIWTSDHIIVGSDSPRYGTIFESFTTLAWLAGKTRRIRVGTSILVLPIRHAILTAKEAATLDQLSEGRLILGVGLGWNQGEYKFVGADWPRRAKHMDESLAVIRNLWSSPCPSFAGEFYRYDNALFFPKPAQKDGPPIWVGGGSAAALRRAARFGDAWHADEAMPADFAAACKTLKGLASKEGRKVGASIRFTVDLFNATRQTRAGAALAGHYMGDQQQVGMRSGSFDAMRDFVRHYREIGATDFVCQFEHDTVPQHVDFIRTFSREIIERL